MWPPETSKILFQFYFSCATGLSGLVQKQCTDVPPISPMSDRPIMVCLEYHQHHADIIPLLSVQHAVIMVISK